jgi:hypothetical protein
LEQIFDFDLSEELYKMADEEALLVLTADLLNLGISMRIFSLSMRSLYCEDKVSASVENGKEFISLRDATRNDAVAYLRGVMPMNETCLVKLQEFFSYYEALKFDDWKECVPDILEEVESYREACQALAKVHDSFLVTLKKREDKAKELCGKFVNLQAQYDKEISKLRKRANTNFGWAVGLSFIPIVGMIASPILFKAGCSDISEAVAKGGQQNIMYAASKSVSNTLMPALENFIEGLDRIAGFFNIMHNELRSFDDRLEDRKRLHYMMLRSKAREIKAGCRAFHGAIPSVRTDFQAIPTEGTDENYVDRWLENQKKIIDENCKQMSRNFLKKALKAVSG